MQMNDNLKELLLWLIKYDENEFIEYKVDDEEPNDIGQYISALSNSAAILNENYGYLVFGVKDKTREIVGTTVSLKNKKKGNEEFENWLTRGLTPNINFEILEFQFEGKQIVIVRIQSAYNEPIKFKHEAYVRIGSLKKKLSYYPEKERLIWGKSNQYGYEEKMALANQTDRDVIKKLDFGKYYDLIDKEMPETHKAKIADFITEGFVKKSEFRYDITIMGAILFAKDLNEFSTLKRKASRIVIYDGNNKMLTKKEYLINKGYAISFEEIVNSINDTLPTNEEIGKVFREQTKMYPEIAVRELVANHLIHQDLSIKGTGPMVEIYENRIEIINPGAPLVDVLRLIDTPPKSRNEKIASFMRRINLCEERGSGIDKTILAIEYYQLPAPEFKVDESNDNTIAILYSQKDFKDMDRAERVRACYQHCALRYASRDYMTNPTLRERFDLGKNQSKTATRIITDTIEAGLVKSYESETNSRKFAKYLPFWG